MNRIATTILAAALLLVPAASRADLAVYSQNFEGLVQSSPSALSGDGWVVYGNVFSPSWAYLYGYGPFPAPNNTGAFSGIDINQGGAGQGVQQLVVYSDYANGDHANGNWVESNVYQQQAIGAADVGSTWDLTFDAKKGNLAGASTALAFIKTLDPNSGWAMTRFITVNMTSIPDTWGTFTLSITIDPGLAGQILQFGFANTATHYESSGIFYDNVSFNHTGATPVRAKTWGSLKALYR